VIVATILVDCWRVVFPVWCFPPCGVSPRGVRGLCAPLRSSDPLVALLSWVHRSSLRASGRQTWAGSSLADAGAPQLHALAAPLQPETLAGTQASPRHGSPTVVSTSSAQSGLPTPAQYDPYTAPAEPGSPNPLQEQMTAQLNAQGEQMNALTVQIAALAAALMAGQRNSAAEVRTPSPRPSPPWTAATLPAASAAPPAPPAPAPPPPPTPAAPPPPTPAAQPTPTPPAAEPLYELSVPDFYDARALDRRFPAVKSLTASITKALKVNLDPITMDMDLDALLNLLRTHDTNMPYYLDMSPEVRTMLLAEGGARAEWLQATDLAVANGVHASLDKDSDNVRNFYSEYGEDRALCSSGRALLAHFKDMFNVITGLALLQAERTMRDLVPFTTGMAAAKTLKNRY